jgi:hypothetical protein
VVYIFGSGQGTALDLGEVAPLACPNCHHDELAAANDRALRR